MFLCELLLEVFWSKGLLGGGEHKLGTAPYLNEYLEASQNINVDIRNLKPYTSAVGLELNTEIFYKNWVSTDWKILSFLYEK